MPAKIAVLNHGYANIGSLLNSLHLLGFSTTVISSYSDYADISDLTGYILPGVGSFGPAILSLRSRKLDKVIHELVSQEIRGLGICLGMQLLCSGSEEDNSFNSGLGYFSGYVRRLSSSNAKVPHIGWSDTFASSSCMLNKSLSLSEPFYYIHSFAYNSSSDDEVAASFMHGSVRACAAIYKTNLLGVQFHPEKSQDAGLALLNDYFTE